MFSQISSRFRIYSRPVRLAPTGGLIGYDLILPYFLNQYFVLQGFFSFLFNCGRFSRHGLFISGFSVSEQDVSDSSSHGWSVSIGWGVS